MLTAKRILIISPQPWGNIFLSKHYYAVELAKKGNEVFFLNPLRSGDYKASLVVEPLNGVPQLHIVKAGLPIPPFLRFKWRGLYNILIDMWSSWMAKKLGGFDIVWCFDPNYFHNLKKIASLVIYHPVDPIVTPAQIRCGKYADVIFAVSEEIMKPFLALDKPKYIINHGVSGGFRALAQKNSAELGKYEYRKPQTISVGYVGNLLRKEIDWELIYTIIGQHPNVKFNFWGPSDVKASNLAGDASEETRSKIEKLRAYRNVILHGSIPSADLPHAIGTMDLFLLIYRYIEGQSDRSNSHKILEFFCTGKTLVSFRVKAYEQHRDLLVMPSDDDDRVIPELFSDVIRNLSVYNDREHVGKRLAFALDSTYEKNVERIEKILQSQEF